MASSSNIPQEVAQFVYQFIPSVAQLEALLLIASGLKEDWSIGEVTDELRSEYVLIEEALTNLHKAGLLRTIGVPPEIRFCYAPDNGALKRQVDTLAILYRERRHSILALIFERPEPKTDPIQAFSDAFRLRNTKEKE